MYIEQIIHDINNIFLNDNDLDNYGLYTQLKNILENIDIQKFNSEINSYNFKKIIEIKNSNDSYTKYILETSDKFDFVYIKWNKNSSTKIHDHPEKGCIVKILSGKLFEELYNNLDVIKYEKTNILTPNMISYRIGKTILHKIIAQENSESIHIYIPGYYNSTNYPLTN